MTWCYRSSAYSTDKIDISRLKTANHHNQQHKIIRCCSKTFRLQMVSLWWTWLSCNVCVIFWKGTFSLIFCTKMTQIDEPKYLKYLFWVWRIQWCWWLCQWKAQKLVLTNCECDTGDTKSVLTLKDVYMVCMNWIRSSQVQGTMHVMVLI